MSLKNSVSLFSCLVIVACASTPQTITASGVNPYDHYAFDHMSRIEIAENLTIKSASLDAAPLLASAPSENITDAHERAATRVISSADRLRNKVNTGEGRSFYIQAQNSFQQDGWVIDDNRLRHVESGLLCPQALSLGEEGRAFALERVVEFDDQGRNVSCLYQAADNGDTIAAYASYWPDIELDQHVAAAVQEILENYTVTGQVQMPVVELKTDQESGALYDLVNGMEEPVAGGFEIGAVNGAPYRTALWLVKTHGWHVKLRASYASADQSSELLSAIHFMATHLAVRAKNMAEPIVPGVDV
jgi:hypothetical protein